MLHLMERGFLGGQLPPGIFLPAFNPLMWALWIFKSQSYLLWLKADKNTANKCSAWGEADFLC